MRLKLHCKTINKHCNTDQSTNNYYYQATGLFTNRRSKYTLNGTRNFAPYFTEQVTSFNEQPPKSGTVNNQARPLADENTVQKPAASHCTADKMLIC